MENSKSIKRLPENLRNTVRSGVVLYDLTRVVEELVFNSLDSAATKVSVHVGVTTSFLKVVDDGSGISRDGLVLLGERYVTSKTQDLAWVDSAKGSFGFRGEALASISDVSSLEIVTKAWGRPNGYRKVMKGSKCLFLGIDDDRKDVGTTVVVRDLFYNQPVRRKCMQTSPKKVLHSIQKCVLRIALFHSNVSFRVIDVESGNELLCTRPSSLKELLMSNFGIEASQSLHEVNVGYGSLKLSGYISDPCNSFLVKAIQYVYINSRFVCNSPIHKLLNNLATSFECMDQWKANNVSHKGKRSRPQALPTYILNLSCSPALYDLAFDPSKTLVEFKDWSPILNCFDKVIRQLWTVHSISCPAVDSFQKENMSKEDIITSVEEDLSQSSEFAVNEGWILNDCASQMDFPTEEIDYLSRAWTGSRCGFISKAASNCDSNLLTPERNTFLPTSDFLEGKLTSTETFDVYTEPEFSGREFQYEPSKIESGWSKEYDRTLLLPGKDLEVIKSLKEPSLKSCSSRRNRRHDMALFDHEEAFGFHGMKKKRRMISADEDSSDLKADVDDQKFGLFSCSRQYEASYASNFVDFDPFLGISAKSSSLWEPSIKEKSLAFDPILRMESFGSDGISLDSEQCYKTLDIVCQGTRWDLEYFEDNIPYKEGVITDKRVNSWLSSCTKEKECSFSYDFLASGSSQNNYTTSQDLDDNGNANEDSNINCHGVNLLDDFSYDNLDKPVPVSEWLLQGSLSKYCENNINRKEREKQLRNQDQELDHRAKRQPRRSHSAPPFYRSKRRFVSLSNHSMVKEGSIHGRSVQDGVTLQKHDDLTHGWPNHTESLVLNTELHKNNHPEAVLDMEEIEHESFKHAWSCKYDNSPTKGILPEEIQESPRAKWRDTGQKFQHDSRRNTMYNENTILDISSGILHLAIDSLRPESIHKHSLMDSKVLQQVDKKFIPIVAGGTLAVIDQHAADERIRLEELREKVLSGEAKSVIYLDSEQQLVLPVTSYQQLHNYEEVIRDWGWICNIHGQSSGTFQRNLNFLHQQSTAVSLLGVPCILGVKLSETDLMEFLQQLTDTDGSSIMPPAVLRILNSKACRGAIMFGDSLLQSECALIVEELKQTSLCFQCAHGRPTTIPLVNLEALHKQIAKLRNLDKSSDELCHGLKRQEISLERAVRRLRPSTG